METRTSKLEIRLMPKGEKARLVRAWRKDRRYRTLSEWARAELMKIARRTK